MSLVSKILSKKKTAQKADKVEHDKAQEEHKKEEKIQDDAGPVRQIREGVIERPFLSEKSSAMTADHNKYVFEVKPKANRKMIKDEIESKYGVKVESVNITNLKGKLTDWRGRTGKRIPRKKAIITLKGGQTIEMG